MPLMPTPRSVDLEITSRCNAHCQYCYYFNNEDVVYQDLPTSDWLEFIDEMGRAQVMRVCISGGEPFLRQDLFEIIAGIVRNPMRFEIFTNGSLVTTSIARKLKETGRCATIQVSLDGSSNQAHESLRGEGSFAPALNAIRILMQQGLPVTVRTTIHPGNIEDLPALAWLLLEDLGLPGFSTNSVSPLGTRAKYDEALFLNPQQRLQAMQVLADLDKRYPGRISASAGPLAEWKMFQEIEKCRLSGKTIPGRGRLVGCGCIFERLAVRADGAYTPCVMLPQMLLGYINKDSLDEIWRNSSILNALRNRIHISLEDFPECKDCEYLHFCTGNCAGTALSESLNPNVPSTQGCLKRLKEELKGKELSLCLK